MIREVLHDLVHATERRTVESRKVRFVGGLHVHTGLDKNMHGLFSLRLAIPARQVWRVRRASASGCGHQCRGAVVRRDVGTGTRGQEAPKNRAG